jgi:hypothetical protein
MLWKEPSLRGRLAWDSRFELLTEDELRRVVVGFNHMSPGWRATVARYPLLVLDRRRHGKEVRQLEAEKRTHVLVSVGPAVVLERR